MCPIFVTKFSGVSDLQGVKVPVFPLTLLVIVTTVLCYRAACDFVAVVIPSRYTGPEKYGSTVDNVHAALCSQAYNLVASFVTV